MENKLITGIIGVVVVVALLGSVLVPVIDGLTEGEKTTNEGAGWIRMDYVTGESYDANVSFDPQGNIRVDTGAPGSGIVNTQTHAADEDTILFASSELTMWLQDGVINILGKDSNGNVFFDQITEIGPIATVMRDGTGSQFSIDTEVPTPLNASSWAYVPKSTGNFGFFDAGTPVDMKDYPVAAVGGGFAGVYASNAAAMYGLPLQMQTELDEDGKLIGGTWIKATLEELNTMEFDPSTITIQPLDPSIIDLDPIDLGGGAQLMSVPTPTYTEGDWGYNVSNGKAIIVSYSGTGGNIVVPATIGGYDVIQIGKDYSSQVIDSTAISANSTLTITNGPSILKGGCFLNCANITGEVVIPDSITTIDCNQSGGCFAQCTGITSLKLGSSLEHIGDFAFYGCNHIVGELVIPDSVKTIGNNTGGVGPFFNCTGITSLKLGSSVEVIGTAAFYGCSNIAGELVIPDSVKTIGKSVTDTSWGAFNGCTKITSIKMGSNIEFISGSAFYNCRGVVGTLLIPSSITTLGVSAFYNAKPDNLIIASDVVPTISGGNTAFAYATTSSTEVLDLSDTVDYSVNRNGINADAVVSDSIGDAIGYVSFIEIGSDPELSGGAAALLTVIPIVVIAGLLVAFVGYSIVKRY